jgi:chromosome segregation ATPase
MTREEFATRAYKLVLESDRAIPRMVDLIRDLAPEGTALAIQDVSRIADRVQQKIEDGDQDLEDKLSEVEEKLEYQDERVEELEQACSDLEDAKYRLEEENADLERENAVLAAQVDSLRRELEAK